MLFLDSIRAAKKTIYVENQYFTSLMIADAFVERLAETAGPEIAVVSPHVPTGLLLRDHNGCTEGQNSSWNKETRFARPVPPLLSCGARAKGWKMSQCSF